jgi:hypothetical protein
VAYSSSVNILTWFSSPVCHVKLHGWGVGEQGNQGERWMVGPAEGPKVSEGCRLIGGVGDWGWLLEWDFEESWTTWSESASIAR